MAADTVTAQIRCPACQEPITLAARADFQGDGTARLHVDTQPVHDHIAQHTAYRPDDTTGA